MKSQKKYFLTGLILLIFAVLCVTFLPAVIRTFFKGFYIQNYIYVEIEFLLMILSSVFYLFSLKFYKFQMLSIALLLIFYGFFIEFYPYIFK